MVATYVAATDRELAIENECKALGRLLVAKNRDYGDTAARPPSLAPHVTPGEALLVRMSDKASRIGNLAAGRRAEVTDEKLADTVRDMAGYCILWLIEHERARR